MQLGQLVAQLHEDEVEGVRGEIHADQNGRDGRRGLRKCAVIAENSSKCKRFKVQTQDGQDKAVADSGLPHELQSDVFENFHEVQQHRR